MNSMIQLLQQLGGVAAQAAIAQWERFKLAFKFVVTVIVLLTLVLLAIGWTCSALGFGWINYAFVVLYTIGWLVFAFWPTHLIVTFVLGVVTTTSLNIPGVREGVKRAAEIHLSIVKYILFGGALTFGFLGLLKVGFAQGLAMMGLTFVMLLASWFFGLKSKWPARIIVTVVGIALTLTFLEILFPGFDGGLKTLKGKAEKGVSGAVSQVGQDPHKVQFTLPAGTGFCDPQKIAVPNGKYTVAYQIPILPMKAYDENGKESLANYKIDEGYDSYKLSATIDGKYVGETVEVKGGTVQFGCTKPGYFSHMKQPPQLIVATNGLLILK